MVDHCTLANRLLKAQRPLIRKANVGWWVCLANTLSPASNPDDDENDDDGGRGDPPMTFIQEGCNRRTGKCQDDKYGIFKIDQSWCDDDSGKVARGRGGGPRCKINCAKLLDGRFHDDVECLEKIIKEGGSVEAVWPEETEFCCTEGRWKSYVKVRKRNPYEYVYCNS